MLPVLPILHLPDVLWFFLDSETLTDGPQKHPKKRNLRASVSLWFRTPGTPGTPGTPTYPMSRDPMGLVPITSCASRAAISSRGMPNSSP